MAKSAKERMKEYRKRLKEDKEKYERHKQADRDRYKVKKEKGVVKSIHNMTPREKRKCRRRWKVNSQSHRDRQNMVKHALASGLTPPASPVEFQNPAVQSRSLSMAKSHKKRKGKERSACYRLTEKLKVKLKVQQKLTERYKKRYYRIRHKHKGNNENEEEEKLDPKSYTLYKTLIMNIRKWYKKTNSRLERRMISNVIVSKRILKRYGLGAYARSVLGLSRRYMYRKERKIRPAGVKIRMKEKVKDFLERDDNSRMTADKQATITRKGVKMQKRLLNADFKTLHEKYESEGNKISYSMFCRLRPYWTVKPTERDRNTCLCKIHENLNYKIETSYTESMIYTKNTDDLMDEIVCTQDRKQCMYRECEQCRDKVLDCRDVDGKQVTWKMWKNQRFEHERKGNSGKPKVGNKTVKDRVQGTRQILADELNKELSRACRHVFNIRHQYRTLKYLNKNMSNEEIMLHIDFSENYNTRYESEIQSVHFGASKQQISLHTGVAYTKDEKWSFCTVSDCLKHGPAGIWAHLDPVIRHLKTLKKFSIIHFVSDGPTTQYRNKLNFYLWCTKIFEYGFTSSTWNFLEASHGKGAADGIGAAVKRAADNEVNIGRMDITCGKDLITCVKRRSKVLMFYIEEESITDLESGLPTSLSPLTDTMKIHQLTTKDRCEVSYRVVSCFCRHPDTCSCFAPMSTSFPDHTLDERASSDHSVKGATQTPTNDEQIPLGNPDTPVSIPSSNAEVLVTQQIDELTSTLIGRYCVIEYEGLPYPGLILDVDEDVEVSAMCRIGNNRFFWPLVDDRLWYPKEKIVKLLECEPELVTKRHRKLPDEIWIEVCDKLGLDDQGKK